MKPLTIIIISSLLAFYTKAQSISPQVLPTAGGYFSNSTASLSFTIGEIASTTLLQSSAIITQGFQQPDFMATDIDEISNPLINISVYPNPTDGLLYLISEGEIISDASLVDVTGRTVREIDINDNKAQLDIHELAAGTYFLLIKNKHETQLTTHKITKVH